MANGKLYRKYYYTGDLITKIEDYTDNQLRLITTFTYDNGMLATRLSLFLNQDPYLTSGIKTIYSYKSNNIISYDEYVGTATEQIKFSSTGIITLLNGQVVKNEADYGTTLVTYDDKNSPFKNITGFDKLMPSYNVAILGNSNPITIKYYNNIINTFYYQYNEQGYPISVYGIDSSGSSSISHPTQYFY
jgi:hypothetical protein